MPALIKFEMIYNRSVVVDLRGKVDKRTPNFFQKLFKFCSQCYTVLNGDAISIAQAFGTN